MELRVLIHAPRGRDGAVVHGVLTHQGIESFVCATEDELIQCLEEGAAALILTEEALPQLVADAQLLDWLKNQPPWSDFPFVVLATKREGRRPDKEFRSLHSLGNLVLLERPLNAETLTSAAESAVRARRRQYAARERLEELKRTRIELERLNGELEDRIQRRTKELASANDRLMKEINERERAQAALTQVQKMEAIGRLTGGIAHDFNNLLHVVNMNLELVSLYAKEEKVKPVVDRAKSAARRGARLTNQLLSFARNQSLMPKVTRVNQLIVGMKDLLEISVGSGVEVEFDLCEEEATVLLDPSQLEMAVLNLAVNSKDAMPEGKLKITTGTRYIDNDPDVPDGDYVLLCVKDTGPGIPANVLPKVFDPFFTTKPVGSGTGLGLSQVYGFARQSGGIARIHSIEGQGTTVEMLFPQADEEGEEEVVVRESAVPARAGACHILVVEDDPDVRRVIVECLSLIGYKVTEAANGAEALVQLRAIKPDLLVVDYAMPDMTGAEVISEARKLIGDVPVILATGYADMAAVERLAGKPRLLRKPFDIAQLGDAVSAMLESAKDKAEA
ncbi:response regulator [Ramlibacter sp. PS3R-8]|uniref:response regulator n=1 Tax=Ramlibacter sp. PS3R-8 TaxID=3133437 RepID=UPI00309E55A9